MPDAVPLKYKIHLEPDLRRLRFDGSTEILVESEAPIREISLNALDLAVWRCRVVVDGTPVSCRFGVDPKKEELRVTLPGEMTGRITLQVDYVGEINSKMAGFYRSTYSQGGAVGTMAVTQFEESDARRAFPCFDHPARKAVFELELLIDPGLTAISNEAVSEETTLEDGRKRVRFRETPRMSTYLLFFGVGPFEISEDPGKVLLRLAARPGMTPYGDYALDFTRKALLYSEEYYGIPYPLTKLDLIAVSDFAAGAMENWGAITFRENLLLRDPEKTSRAGEERICEVIAHEMAHQWFGNLVTPADWKYLWLNESFATFFGYGVVHHYRPEWEMWSRFLQSQTSIALERDGLKETFPIEIPGGEHVVINASTAPIIYNKGGSLLRQIEGYVGAESLRDGLRKYLQKHAYGCATSHDLWEAMETASSKPVSIMIRNWVEQPGYPLLSVRREGGRLFLGQERFSYLPRGSEQVWLIPVAIRVFSPEGGSSVIQTLLDRRDMEVEIGREATSYHVNAGQTGFYRVRYADGENLHRLGRMAAAKRLSPEERWGLQNDLYALVKRGEVSLAEYLDFLVYYDEEESFLPLTSIGDHLHHAFLITRGDVRGRVLETGKKLAEKALERIGYDPDPGERHSTSILREQMLWHSALYGSRDALRFGGTRFGLLKAGQNIHPDLMRPAMQIGALQGGSQEFDWFDRVLGSSQNEHERINVLTAMGCFRGRESIERALQYVLASVPDRNKFIVVGAMAANPFAFPLLWEWYLSSLSRLEQLHPVHYERVIAAIVPLSGLGREEDVRAFFADYMSRKDLARDVIRLSLERLEVNSAMRRRKG
ncbi:MAG: M1 family metallopeptidase [Thermodesulfobacteriota bacterium]